MRTEGLEEGGKTGEDHGTQSAQGGVGDTAKVDVKQIVFYSLSPFRRLMQVPPPSLPVFNLTLNFTLSAIAAAAMEWQAVPRGIQKHLQFHWCSCLLAVCCGQKPKNWR